MNFPFLSATVGLALSFSSFAIADGLPVLTDKPWLGYWVGYEEREFDFGVSGKGVGELFLKQRNRGEMARISLFRTLKVRYLVEEEVGGKWQRRGLQEKQLESDLEATAEVEKCSFVANYTGGSKAKISHRFDGEKVFTTIELLEAGSDNPTRVAVEVVIPDLYRLQGKGDERELKKKLKGDEVVTKTLAGKKMKFDLYEDINLGTEKGLEGGVAEFSLECKNLAEKTIMMSSAVDRTGTIQFKQKGAMNEGFAAVWYPLEAPKGKATPELVIEVK